MKTRLKQLRKSKGLTQMNLATAIGCSQNTISRIELEHTNTDPEILLDIASYFNISIDYLLCRTEQKQLLVEVSASPKIQHMNEYRHKFQLLSDRDKETVFALIDHLLEASNNNGEKSLC